MITFNKYCASFEIVTFLTFNSFFFSSHAKFFQCSLHYGIFDRTKYQFYVFRICMQNEKKGH